MGLSLYAPPEMEVVAKNLGPVTSARVRLSPLTVFVGPNNSGKSFMAMLAYAACRASAPGYRYIPSVHLNQLRRGSRTSLPFRFMRLGQMKNLSQDQREQFTSVFEALAERPNLRASSVPVEVVSLL